MILKSTIIRLLTFNKKPDRIANINYEKKGLQND